MAIKNRLKEIRMREYMLNQKEFAEEILKISVFTYNPIESNKKQGNIETIFKISKALNRRIEDIWFYEAE
ncbi:helix-turn-helix domain-containing protein [Clostridium sp. CX1]|uniref:helix-turn-helix transcriptional regulator n=1 Tax=Clostridium sp. CX1 TaxID=2978346 RepID=UPI0021C22D33|nr:helix-turn-helix domain-containing protein [Clostridium sp. CX1]MCT8976281.1 helix-turn-helix domain-containing protein [Clostridium sp. CX1]